MLHRSNRAITLLSIALASVVAIVPWFHTPLTSTSVCFVAWILALNGAVFVGVALLHRFRGLPWTAVVSWILLLIQGWLMVINARGIYQLNANYQSQLNVDENSKLWLPGALDAVTARETMIRITGIAAVFGGACMVGRSPRRRRRVVATMVFITTAIAVEGLLERAHVFDLYNAQRISNEGLGFASFNYHANAGAFLNLGFALACGNAAVMRHRSVQRAVYLGAAAICLAGILATGSRGAALISAGIIAVTIIVLFARARPGSGPARSGVPGPRRTQAIAVAVGGVVLIAALTIVVCLFGAVGLQRWLQSPVHLSETNPRLLLWKLALPKIMEAGAFGFGPGNLKILLSLNRDHFSPLFNHWIFLAHEPARPISMWMQLHNDPLQTIAEWGFIGTALWAILIGGAFVRRHWCNPEWFAVLLAIASCLVHGCFDFPLQIPAIQIYMAALLGLAWSGRCSSRRFNPVQRISR